MDAQEIIGFRQEGMRSDYGAVRRALYRSEVVQNQTAALPLRLGLDIHLALRVVLGELTKEQAQRLATRPPSQAHRTH
jgi:hypothetical protein